MNDNKDKISCCIDNQLQQSDVEQLIDSLLNNSSVAKEMRDEWHDMHLLSENIATNNQASDFVFEIKDVSTQVSQQIEQEVNYKLKDQSFVDRSTNVASILNNPSILADFDLFIPFKFFATATAFAASLVLVVFNIVNMQETNFSNKRSMIVNQQKQNPGNISSSSLNSTPVSYSKSLSQNLLPEKDAISNKKLLNKSIENLDKTPNYYSKKNNGIQKVSLEQLSHP